MKYFLWLIASIGLGLTIIPAFLVFQGTISLDLNKNLMVVGMLLWFVGAAFLLKKKPA